MVVEQVDLCVQNDNVESSVKMVNGQALSMVLVPWAAMLWGA